MAMTETTPLRKPLAALAAAALVLAACSGAEQRVVVPGAAPMDQPGSPADEAIFTEVPSEPEEVETRATTTTLTIDSTPGVPIVAESRVGGEPEIVDTSDPSTSPSDPPTVPARGVPSAVSPDVTGWAAFDLHLMTILQAGSNAVSATVLRDGEVVHSVALGDRTASDAVSIGDRYRVASISKVVTAITVLRLVEQGAIGLDDVVGSRVARRVGVSTPADGVEDVTVRHLLTHRSGVGQYENLMFRRQVESCSAAAAHAFGRSLERTPGSTFRYSNVNFCALGLLIEEVTGRPYEDVVRAELLTPLGIEGMRLAGTFDVGDDDVEHRSAPDRNYMEVLGASGSWVASPTEVATIIDSLDRSTAGWKPLAPDSIAEMRTITQDPPPPPLTDEQAATTSSTVVAPAPPSRGYGMGLMIFGPDSFGHTGTLESTHAMTVRQADGITWAVTVSGDHPSSSRDLAGIVAEGLRYAGVNTS